ncbi:MAG TPA: TIGR03435 family protein [Acidobacteriaceae bacterium]|nr:TIGR03435 family protein [Acidobacteriaceae bacterium]
MIARLPPLVPGRHRIGGRNVTLAMLAESLPPQTGLATFPRPVIDRTSLEGTFDFTLEWTQMLLSNNNTMAVGPNAQGENPGPPIGQALKQQLGLKLESTRGPVEVLVIDHVERPSAN